MAGWIAPPPRGIHGKPIDYEYVKFPSEVLGVAVRHAE